MIRGGPERNQVKRKNFRPQQAQFIPLQYQKQNQTARLAEEPHFTGEVIFELNMRTPAKAKGKAAQMRQVEDVAALDFFPTYHEKTRSKVGTCKISECTIQESKRPLRFFNTLFFLRTVANIISCPAVMFIADALNGKIVDWPEIFRDNLIAELRSIKEELFKDKSLGIKSMVGPPLTMLLITK
jgi:hypothetical protein